MADSEARPYVVERREVVAETDDLRVSIMTLAPGQEVPWHYHSHVTDTFYCLEGVLSVETRAPPARHLLDVGESCAVPPTTAHRVTGRQCRGQGVGRHLDDLFCEIDLDHELAIQRFRREGWSHRITHLRARNGERVPVELQAVDLGDGTFQSMAFDMREWVAIEAKLKDASQRDNLTGLLNRRAIEEHAEVEIHRARLDVA